MYTYRNTTDRGICNMNELRTTRTHPQLGTLVFDDKARWWVGRVVFGGHQDVRLTVDAPRGVDDTFFEIAARILTTVECDALKDTAVMHLYAVFDRSWRSSDGPDVDQAGFRALLRPVCIAVQDDGAASVSFDDGQMFGGHTIIVGLDASLQLREAELAG
jgi:hypothetical protein